mgnify:CR=1 FL=1
MAAAAREDALCFTLNGKCQSPLQLWFVDADKAVGTGNLMTKGQARELIPRAVAGEISRLLEEGRAKGAFGGKLSGAGGGGAFFLICADPETARDAAAALRQLSGSLRLPTADTIYPLSWMPESGG